MEKFFDTLRKCPLFNEIEDENLISMLGCIEAKVVNYKKFQTIIAEGESSEYIGVLLSGMAQIERVDFHGNRSIVTHIEPSELFGESFACAGIKEIPFSVIASEDSHIMLIDCKKIISSCTNACSFHNHMIFNLLKIVATKNIILNQKLEITAKRTTREKLLTYLYIQAKKNDSNSFNIPYDRQQLADYLEVDRSGLSAEISKLRMDGIIESRKNFFKLLL